jgi:HD-GYP domain-containing protein (c-di-GMP phosphodiesterase class II)
VGDNHLVEKFDIMLNELQEGMLITAYSGFGPKYVLIDKKMCQFIRHNFKNCKLIVTRDGKNCNITSEELQENDSVIRIFDFPPQLAKLAQVNPQLIKALRSRDITKFDVKHKAHLSSDSRRELQQIIQLVNQSTKQPSLKQSRRFEAIRETNELIRKVNESAKVRKDVADSVEYAMDNARRGKNNIDDIKKYVDKITEDVSADAMAAIASIKASDQTYAHCVDVGVIFQNVYNLILAETGRRSAFQSQNESILSAFLHDFGKSQIPKDLLDSTMRFERDSKEMRVMMSHPVYGAKLLENMGMPKSIVNMAHFHHVKQDMSMLSSYPAGFSYENVSFETRLLSIVDAYQALVGRRKYKRSWSPPATMRYIDALSGVEYDYEVWLLFLKIMGMFPKGSLVQLSNHSIGFVVSVPKKEGDPERPIVAVVRNEYGEDLEHHELVDLQDTLDISIVRDLDNQEVFGSNALDVFMAIEIS